jgi:penicillin-binding protein 2
MIGKQLPHSRLNFLKISVYVLSFLFVLKVVNLQILRYDHYKGIAERNKTQIISQTASRGRIFTKDKVLVGGSRPSFSLVYFPFGDVSSIYAENLSNTLSKYLNLPLSEIRKKLFMAVKRGTPVRIAENLSDHSMFLVKELKTVYQGINIITEAQRFYPMNGFLSHLVGYIGKISPSEWKYLRNNKNYSMDSYIGKTGIEKRFEKDLKGEDGGVYLEVDSKGRLMQILEGKKSVRGSNIYLTIDSKVQAAAEEGLRATGSGSGAVVAIDPRNGAILAFASLPDYDLNAFVEGSGSGKNLKNIKEFNYATQGTFPPASTFKIIVAAAGLETGKIDLNEKTMCPGYFDAGARVFKCWKKKGHGLMDFYEGMTHSCDVYYYTLGIKTGPLSIERMAKKFRLGVPTGIKMPNEKSGNVFGPSRRAKKKSYWFIGDTLNLSIGQGEMLVTPIQMAQVIAAVANKGKFWQPYYVDEVVNLKGYKTFASKPKLVSEIGLKESTWEYLRESIKRVVSEGTGYSARVKGATVYGKTGTAQNPHGDDHAWFVAFAEIDGQPSEIAVCVLVEHGEHGSSAAAPIAKRVMAAALRDKLPKKEIKKKAQEVIKQKEEIQQKEEIKKEEAIIPEDVEQVN